MSGVAKPPLRGRTVALLGAGGLARALGAELLARGARVVVAARRRPRARALVRHLGRGAHAADSFAEAAAEAELVFLCVSDDALAEVARALARSLPRSSVRGGRDAGKVALHASGFHGEQPLAPLARAGWSTGSLHPLLPLPHVRRGAERLSGAWFASSGDARALRAAHELVRAFQGHELALRRGAKPEYHLAATLVSNGALALFELARRRFARVARRPREAQLAYAALLGATASNLAGALPRAALTGPVARGDLACVRGHLALLHTREERETYRALGRVLLALSNPRRRSSPERARALHELLQ